MSLESHLIPTEAATFEAPQVKPIIGYYPSPDGTSNLKRPIYQISGGCEYKIVEEPYKDAGGKESTTLILKKIDCREPTCPTSSTNPKNHTPIQT